MAVEYRRVACEVLFYTDKAVQVQVEETEHWLPLSALDPDQDPPAVGNLGVLYVAEWKADELGLTECSSESDEEHEPDVVIFRCRRKPAVVEGRRVSHSKFGQGSELSTAGDKSVVIFDGERAARTILSRFLDYRV